MPNTYTQVYIQIVFAVKHREALISPVWKERVPRYITGIVQNQGHKLIIDVGLLRSRCIMTKKSQRKTPPSIKHSALPLFCDFTCRHADFASAEASGACRREMAVYCTLFKRFNNKHNRCLDRI